MNRFCRKLILIAACGSLFAGPVGCETAKGIVRDLGNAAGELAGDFIDEKTGAGQLIDVRGIGGQVGQEQSDDFLRWLEEQKRQQDENEPDETSLGETQLIEEQGGDHGRPGGTIEVPQCIRCAHESFEDYVCNNDDNAQFLEKLQRACRVACEERYKGDRDAIRECKTGCNLVSYDPSTFRPEPNPFICAINFRRIFTDPELKGDLEFVTEEFELSEEFGCYKGIASLIGLPKCENLDPCEGILPEEPEPVCLFATTTL